MYVRPIHLIIIQKYFEVCTYTREGKLKVYVCKEIIVQMSSKESVQMRNVLSVWKNASWKWKIHWTTSIDTKKGLFVRTSTESDRFLHFFTEIKFFKYILTLSFIKIMHVSLIKNRWNYGKCRRCLSGMGPTVEHQVSRRIHCV